MGWRGNGCWQREEFLAKAVIVAHGDVDGIERWEKISRVNVRGRR